MNIYAIDAEICSLIDEDTGEIADYDRFVALLGARENKIESAAVLYKQFTADADEIKKEIDTLIARKKAAENNAVRIKQYVSDALDGSRFESAKCKVTFRKSSAVEIADESEFIRWAKDNADDLLNYIEPKISKTAVSSAILAGRKVPLAKIVEHLNIQIK